jgi:hypothetical protein
LRTWKCFWRVYFITCTYMVVYRQQGCVCLGGGWRGVCSVFACGVCVYGVCVCIFVCVWVCMCTFVWVFVFYVCVCVCWGPCLCVCICLCLWVCLCMCLCVCFCVCWGVCVCVFVNNLYMLILYVDTYCNIACWLLIQ